MVILKLTNNGKFLEQSGDDEIGLISYEDLSKNFLERYATYKQLDYDFLTYLMQTYIFFNHLSKQHSHGHNSI